MSWRTAFSPNIMASCLSPIRKSLNLASLPMSVSTLPKFLPMQPGLGASVPSWQYNASFSMFRAIEEQQEKRCREMNPVCVDSWLVYYLHEFVVLWGIRSVDKKEGTSPPNGNPKEITLPTKRTFKTRNPRDIVHHDGVVGLEWLCDFGATKKKLLCDGVGVSSMIMPISRIQSRGPIFYSKPTCALDRPSRFRRLWVFHMFRLSKRLTVKSWCSVSCFWKGTQETFEWEVVDILLREAHDDASSAYFIRRSWMDSRTEK